MFFTLAYEQLSGQLILHMIVTQNSEAFDESHECDSLITTQ